MEIVAVIAFLGGFIALIVWAVKYGKKVNKRRQALFEDFANRKGLTYTSTKMFMNNINRAEGDLHGSQFIMYEKMVGSGKNRHLATFMEFNNSPLTFDFKIGKEHLFSKAGKMLGWKDIEMGDEAFDKRFLLKSKSEDEFRALMTYDLQASLQALDKDLVASIRANKGSLTYSTYAALANEKQFKAAENVIDFMEKLLKPKR